MPTPNPRVNVTLTPDSVTLLHLLATKKHQSLSRVTRDLVLEGLDHYEDFVLSSFSEEREAKSTKAIPHSEAWK